MGFDKISKRLGFGAMRLKMNGEEVDYGEFCNMIDAFIKAGFNYFDTAHGYIDGKSEIAIGKCLAARYNREEYVLANKLSEWFVKKEEDVLPFFEKQLEICGVDYFDYYLCHAVDRENYLKYKEINAFGIIKELKKRGKVKHMAISFHDTAEVLDMILTEQPDIEVVQLQINYLDYDDKKVQSKACYDTAVKHGKKVIVMEPVKGGALVNLPEDGAKLLDDLGNGSYASYALRFAAEHSQVITVLSGMGSVEMLKDNIDTMSDPKPLSPKEHDTLCQIREIIRREKLISCTSCNYCKDVCPKSIPISEIFGVYNGFLSAKYSVEEALTKLCENCAKPADCIKCGKCESVCPQGIEIPKLLEKIQKDLS